MAIPKMEMDVKVFIPRLCFFFLQRLVGQKQEVVSKKLAQTEAERQESNFIRVNLSSLEKSSLDTLEDLGLLRRSMTHPPPPAFWLRMTRTISARICLSTRRLGCPVRR